MSWQLEAEHPLGPALRVRRHRLDTGLVLISCIDHAAPIVSYQTWYGVGSRHERPGATGMAHLFEHLMFNQTRSLPAGEFDKVIEATGGDTNAATWVDWTFYRNSVPARDLELVARLEAERMTDLVLDAEQLEAERHVVMNERLQHVDDDVDGFAEEQLFKLAFRTHPYGWPTIGWMADIEALGLDAVREFYRTFYAPNNATLVVVGDVEEARLLDVVAGAYGAIAPAPLPDEQLVREAAQTAEQRAEHPWPTAAPRLTIGYRAPALGHRDWPALSATAALLAGSPSSRLYRSLVIERELASTVHCDIMPFRDPSLFQLSIAATRGADADEIERIVDDELAALAASTMSDEEIAKVHNLTESWLWGDLEGNDGKAEALGHYQTTLGDFAGLFTMAERLAAVTPDDVRRVAARYLERSQRTAIRIVPASEAAE